MKTAALTRDYFESQVKSLMTFFDKPANRFTEKHFHDLRVELKQIKSVLALLQQNDPKFNLKKLYKPFKKIFDLAGKVREAQVELEMLQPYITIKAIEHYSQELQGVISKQKKKFFDAFSSKMKATLQKAVEKILTEMQKADDQLGLADLGRKERQAKKLLQRDPLKRTDVHALRKELKVIYYLHKMLKPKHPHLTVPDEFQELLGKWHDGRVLLASLKKYLDSHFLLTREANSITSLRRRIDTANDKLLQKYSNTKLHWFNYF